jgi:hypothetical protein
VSANKAAGAIWKSPFLCLGSARVFAIADFSKDCFGETPKPTREVRAGLALRALPNPFALARKSIESSIQGSSIQVSSIQYPAS